MHKSLRTRLLLSAYRAARDLSYRLHQFASSLQERAAASETQDYEVYLGKLDEEHTILADGASAADRRLTEIEGEYKRVSDILGYTPRAQVPPFNEVQHITPADLTELDLTSVDADDAPQGYKAVACQVPNTCMGCAFDPTEDCPANCTPEGRGDGQGVIYLKR